MGVADGGPFQRMWRARTFFLVLARTTPGDGPDRTQMSTCLRRTIERLVAAQMKRHQVAMHVNGLKVVEKGLRVSIRRSKTDREGAGQVIAVARGEVHCPVQTVQARLDAAGITKGPVFRPVTEGGRPRREALTTKSVAQIVKTYTARAGLEASEFSSHSPRAGSYWPFSMASTSAS